MSVWYNERLARQLIVFNGISCGTAGERIVDSPVKREPRKEEPKILCEECGKPVYPMTKGDGKILSVEEVAEGTRKAYGKCLCSACAYLAKSKKA